MSLRARFGLVRKWQAFVKKQDSGAILPTATPNVQRVVNKQPLERPIKALQIQAIFEKHILAQAKARSESLRRGARCREMMSARRICFSR